MDLLDAPTTAPPAPAPGRPRQRRASGRRTAAQARRRRAGRRLRWARQLRRAGVAFLSVVALAGVAALVTSLVTGGDDALLPGEGDAPAGVVADQSTLLLVREEPGARGAAGLTLLATSGDGSASATFIPSTTLVEIPGVGLDRLALAHQYGGADLIGATVENTLGIEIDHVASVTSADLGALLQRAGGAEIDIDGRLVNRQADGTGTVAFESGSQYLNGVRLAEYWGFVQRGETELDTFPRQQRALEAMLLALDDDVLREALLSEVPPELSTTAEPAFLRDVFGLLADAAAREVLVYQLLPVAPFGSADETMGASYQVRSAEAAEMVATTLAGSVPEGGGASAPRIQILNGVGLPGIGQRVDEAIEGLGFRIVLSENARSFDFLETQIVIYEETPERLRAARQVQEALGVGTILVSRQPQSVVDMTVVVGADFLGQQPSAPAGL